MAARLGGPSSAVTRYQDAVAKQNARLLQAVTVGDVQSPASVTLYRTVGSILSTRPEVKMAGARRTLNKNQEVRAEVEVVYASKLLGIVTVTYIVVKRNGVWAVDPEATLGQRSLAPGV